MTRERDSGGGVTCDTTTGMEKTTLGSLVFYAQRIGFDRDNKPILKAVPAIVTALRADDTADLTLFEPGKVSHLEGVKAGESAAEYRQESF